MARYIDADALYIEVTEKYHDIVAGSYPFNVVAHDMAQLVKNAPTADVVEVVRCKDCAHYNTNSCADGFGWCEHINYGVLDNHYCRCGERKNESTT